jgi:hypothetical protein
VSEAPLRLLFDVQGEIREAAKECEADVFFARFGNTAQDLAEAYGKYESTTHFMAVTDQTRRVMGAARLIFPGPAGLKTLDDVAEDPWRVDPRRAAAEAGLDLSRTMDGTTFAVRDGLRRQGFAVSHALLYGMFGGMEANGVSSLVAMIDSVVIEMLRKLGLIFETIPGTGSRPYFGSAATTPMYAHLDQLMSTQKRLAPLAHRAIGEGIGLAGVDVPPMDDLRIASEVS